MKKFSGIDSYIKNDGTILVLGMFDGMHLGHQALFDKARSIKGDCTITALTFDSHFTGCKSTHKTLMSLDEKVRAIFDAGADEIIVENVTEDFINTSADEFIALIKDKINIKWVVAGFDFTFGKNGLGNSDTLKNRFDNVVIVDEVAKDGKKISSTRLRKCLEIGDVETYSWLCGVPYTISGPVVHGQCIGRKFCMPTINVKVTDEKLFPKPGVYITRIKIGDKVYNSISSLGSAPTFEREESILEVHVFDFCGSVYDENVEVYFCKYMRDIVKFTCCEGLYCQIHKDIDMAKKYFNS